MSTHDSARGPDSDSTASNAVAARNVWSTGNQEIDLVLGGGIPNDALMMLTGAPGAGKTILTQCIAFAAARAGRRVIYLTNVSEPHEKMVEHLQGFDFLT